MTAAITDVTWSGRSQTAFIMASAPVITPAGIPTPVWQSNNIIMPPAAAGAAITWRGWPAAPPACGYKRRPCNVLHQYVPGSGYSMSLAMSDCSVHRSDGQQDLSSQWDCPEGGGLLLP